MFAPSFIVSPQLSLSRRHPRCCVALSIQHRCAHFWARALTEEQFLRLEGSDLAYSLLITDSWNVDHVLDNARRGNLRARAEARAEAEGDDDFDMDNFDDDDEDGMIGGGDEFEEYGDGGPDRDAYDGDEYEEGLPDEDLMMYPPPPEDDWGTATAPPPPAGFHAHDD